MGWKAAARGSHSVPSSLTTTTTLHSGTALSTRTYFPVSEKTASSRWPSGERRAESQGRPERQEVLHSSSADT
ncbi:hypothetical protein EYF80_062120 [Liparis tanakae]|uniref:Uncharacterized protein n=1 Tax=Liparis tanakae TaxID=230148 RepID=A0A4Z2EG31_9TELE|nr:hypothetical protein EYF80_062120 [Liparis tanakae]